MTIVHIFEATLKIKKSIMFAGIAVTSETVIVKQAPKQWIIRPAWIISRHSMDSHEFSTESQDTLTILRSSFHIIAVNARPEPHPESRPIVYGLTIRPFDAL